MVHYRRNRIAGGTYAFTVTLRDRKLDLLIREVESLRTAFTQVRSKRPFTIHAAVVLPDHMHMLWQLPDGDADFSTRWQLIKSAFNRNARLSESPWQSRFWEHTIRNDRDFENHVNYIHFNPVRHGYVIHAADWKFSSIHRWIRSGQIPKDWGLNENLDLKFGER